MTRLCLLALLLLGSACAPLLDDPILWARPNVRLYAPPQRGLHVVARPTGGRARAVRLDTDLFGFQGFSAAESATCDDPDEEEALLAGCDAAGFGHGFGMGASGLGTLGAAGAGGGLARAQRAGDEAARCRATDVSASPWGWAVVDLPYRDGPPAHFEGRPEATVSETVVSQVDQLSTFGVDVDTAAYAITRRALLSGARPEPTLVRTEELLNHFRYRYPEPSGLVGVHTDGARSPYAPDRYLLRVGVSARALSEGPRAPVNLVFLVDTSGSMSGSDRLDLVKSSLHITLDALGPEDEVSIVTYAGQTKVVLPATPATDRAAFARALQTLTASGGTSMGTGLELAYVQAEAMHAPGEHTSVVVCSDGDANIGPSRAADLLAYIADHARRGVALNTVGFGTGNYRDRIMENLANRGDGAYHYVDAPRQARRVFGEDILRGLHHVAKDVKIQVALDTSAVTAWRLVGYENRALADEDFEDDAVDAGDVGAGHQVTAIYELTLAPGASGRLAEVRVRARPVDGGPTESTQRTVDVRAVARPFAFANQDLVLATAVLGFAEHLRSPRGPDLQSILHIAEASGADQDPDRAELVALVRRAINDT